MIFHYDYCFQTLLELSGKNEAKRFRFTKTYAIFELKEEKIEVCKAYSSKLIFLLHRRASQAQRKTS